MTEERGIRFRVIPAHFASLTMCHLCRATSMHHKTLLVYSSFSHYRGLSHPICKDCERTLSPILITEGAPSLWEKYVVGLPQNEGETPLTRKDLDAYTESLQGVPPKRSEVLEAEAREWALEQGAPRDAFWDRFPKKLEEVCEALDREEEEERSRRKGSRDDLSPNKED